MSFAPPFQGQQNMDDGSAAGSVGMPPQQPQVGQPIESAAGQFPGAPNMTPTGPGAEGNPVADGKTTLW